MIGDGVFAVQGVISLVLTLAALGVEVWALVEAVRFKAAAYTAAGKQTKPLWVAITAAAVAIGVLVLGNPLSFFNLLAVGGAAAFLAGVRPALRPYQGRGRGGRPSGGGPYGGW